MPEEQQNQRRPIERLHSQELPPEDKPVSFKQDVKNAVREVGKTVEGIHHWGVDTDRDIAEGLKNEVKKVTRIPSDTQQAIQETASALKTEGQKEAEYAKKEVHQKITVINQWGEEINKKTANFFKNLFAPKTPHKRKAPPPKKRGRREGVPQKTEPKINYQEVTGKLRLAATLGKEKRKKEIKKIVKQAIP